MRYKEAKDKEESKEVHRTFKIRLNYLSDYTNQSLWEFKYFKNSTTDVSVWVLYTTLGL